MIPINRIMQSASSSHKSVSMTPLLEFITLSVRSLAHRPLRFPSYLRPSSRVKSASPLAYAQSASAATEELNALACPLAIGMALSKKILVEDRPLDNGGECEAIVEVTG